MLVHARVALEKGRRMVRRQLSRPRVFKLQGEEGGVVGKDNINSKTIKQLTNMYKGKNKRKGVVGSEKSNLNRVRYVCVAIKKKYGSRRNL